jgi:hypothetical protein
MRRDEDGRDADELRIVGAVTKEPAAADLHREEKKSNTVMG